MENLMEILIPIIFFIIWTLSSVSATKKKKQKTAPPERGPYPQSQYPQESVPPPPVSSPAEDLKRTLETIFSEMAGEKPEAVEPQQPEEKIPPQPTEPPPVQVSKPVVREITPSPKTAFDTSVPQEEVSFSLSNQELRKAIILMEILSPPVSMRK